MASQTGRGHDSKPVESISTAAESKRDTEEYIHRLEDEHAHHSGVDKGDTSDGPSKKEAKGDVVSTRENVWQSLEPFRRGRNPSREDIQRVVQRYFNEENGASPVSECKQAFKDLLTQTGCNKYVDNALLDQAIFALAPDAGLVKRADFLFCWNYWMKSSRERRSALLIIDVQNDFIDGSLALRNCDANEEGVEVVPIINTLRSSAPFDTIVLTKDWHPPDHISFHTNLTSSKLYDDQQNISDIPLFAEVTLKDGLKQKLWPPHCVQKTQGGELNPGLEHGRLDYVVQKGVRSDIDSYSAFYDNGRRHQTELLNILRKHEIVDLYCCGLAFDVCVAYTALDGASEGFRVYVVRDACRSVSNKTASEMTRKLEDAGVKFVASADVPSLLENHSTNVTD